ncbi:hypothetical protein ASPWEDRAFT_45261 [Aspergillus wentii DTO 134E9]|uniref:FAD-binding PCMH-type domain-containing protein n=1 Tax=Aspergillus wentii DTO 134E9 TaxID=1073089 RepID=A0A1L9R8S6_ASPWE|nr:uncharacterized protein ASPWEDRAFT_45261 [Aspergillus wentii DTO 134E9]KAI9925123.1 hypothetical protein MW887_006531 [Aspergillus wentii]OJJ31309.1 hypothetical protein ASPWEDRAFT_45261 [Aspergillus wentii DTO 134E9]
MDELIRNLKSRRIAVYTAGELEYERSVANANLLFRYARPDCVVQPDSAWQIQKIVQEVKKVNEAKSQGISIVVKNGGHSYAGFSTSDRGSISLDLVKMNHVEIDKESMTATIEGGAVWAHAYRQLVNNHMDGYVINGGRCPSVGVSGFILGGGLSPFTRTFGMGCDGLKEATIVLADGRLITVGENDDATTNEGKLFWALRGAGGGNFGVVVEVKLSIYRLREIEKPSDDGTGVISGRYTWSPKPSEKDMTEFMETMKKFYITPWPNSMTIDSTWICRLGYKDGELEVRFPVYFNGIKEDFDQIINEHIGEKHHLSKKLTRRCWQDKSTRFLHENLVSQWSEETQKALPSNASYRIFTSLCFKADQRDDEGNNIFVRITETLRKEMAAFRQKFVGEEGTLQVTFIHAGGKATGPASNATAFPWREAVYHAYIQMEWTDKWLELDMRGFCQRLKEELKPFSIEKGAAFINFPDGDLPPGQHESVYYGNNRHDLQRVKQIWDKDNFFKWKQGVGLPPTSQTPAATAGKKDDDPAAPQGDSALDSQVLTDKLAKEQWEKFDPSTALELAASLPFFPLGWALIPGLVAGLKSARLAGGE